MDDVALILRLDLTDSAPEGAGWYVYATGEKQLIRRPQRISGRFAAILASHFEQGLGPKQDGSEISPSELVRDGNAKVVQRIQEQIALAEAQARRIQALRRALNAESETLEPPPERE